MTFQGVDLGVEEGHVEAHEADEETEDGEGVGGFLEGGQVKQGALLGRENAHAHAHVGNNHGSKDEEANDPRRPREPDLRQQLVKDNRVDDATERASARGKAYREREFGREIRTQDGDAGHEDATRADADAEGLREEHLPVLGAE